MIREYRQGDLDGFVENGSNLDFDKDIFIRLVANNMPVYVLEDNQKVIALLGYYSYSINCYYIFLLASNNMRARHGKEIKDWIWKLIRIFEPVRLETLSLSCPKLDAWHKFIGMTCEGIKRKYMFGKDFKVWSIVDGHRN